MRTIYSIIGLLIAGSCWSITPAEVRFHNEAADTTTLTQILIDIDAMGLETPEAILPKLVKDF